MYRVRSVAAVFRATPACTCSKTIVVSKTVWMHGCCAKWLMTDIKPNVLNSKMLWLPGVRHFCKFAMRYRGGISTVAFFKFLVCRVRSLAAVFRATPACTCSKTIVVSKTVWMHGCCAKWLMTDIKPNVLNSKMLWLPGVRHFCKFAMRYRGGISTVAFFKFLVCRVRSLAAVRTRHTPVACFCFAHWTHGC